jgi:hypothetical protein
MSHLVQYFGVPNPDAEAAIGGCVARFNELGIADESREVIPSLQQPIDKS